LQRPLFLEGAMMHHFNEVRYNNKDFSFLGQGI